MSADRYPEDSSLPLILINGLRRGSNPHHDGSSNTSEKDDSGGDDTVESYNNNMFSKSSNSVTGMPTASIGASTTGPMSSLSGSEEGNQCSSINSGNIIREGILRKSGNITTKSDSMSTASSNVNGDELSECVVVRGKSVTGGGLPQEQQQTQVKVSFAGSTVVAAPFSSKRKRQHEGGSKCDNGSDQRKKKMYLEMNAMSSNSFSGSQPLATVSTSSTTAYTQGQAPFKTSASEQQKDMQEGEPAVGSPLLSSSNNTMQKKHPQHLSRSLAGPSNEERRLERNQREKERSNRIACQVDSLRTLLQRGGLFIPKNTKSTVLSEASNYIKTLQDRQQLMSMEMEGLKKQLVDAMAAKKLQQQPLPPSSAAVDAGASSSFMSQTDNKQCTNDSQDYHLIFKNTIAGMVVASMGGALFDCNAAFQNITGLSAKDLQGKTIFDIVHPTDLPRALDLISRMIDDGYVVSNPEGDAPADSVNNPAPAPLTTGVFNGSPMVVLKSSFHHRPDLGLCVSLIRGEESVGKCFCITLAKNVPPTTQGYPQQVHQIPFNPSLPTCPSMDPCITKIGKQGNEANCNTLEPKYGAPPPPNQEIVESHAGQQQLEANAGVINAPVNTIMSNAIPEISGIPPHLLQLILISQQQQQQQQQQQILPPNSSSQLSANGALHGGTVSMPSTFQAPPVTGLNPPVAAIGQMPVAQSNVHQQGGPVQLQQLDGANGINFTMPSGGPTSGSMNGG